MRVRALLNAPLQFIWQNMSSENEKEDKKKEAPKGPAADSPEVELEQSEDAEGIASSFDSADANTHLRRMMDRNFIEYASYVIKDRAIPEMNDGLKPVQRRILWSLHKMDDGRFHKVANVVGHTMQFHPHGDQSIYGALVVLANKDYFIERQGNFGNILTGDAASAARYIECRLTQLARETLFNGDITEFTDSYDGRNKEPVFLPAKVPSLLMLGHEGIAPGMTTRILPHNFGELLNAQIAILEGHPFEIYPDFQQGGIMDASDYQDGTGKVVVRAKIEIDGRKLVIREIPAFTTTETLIASIERAAAKSKIKIAAINDYTGEKVEIEITPQRGYEPEKALKALYAYTDCSMTISSNILVIRDNRPVMCTVSDALKQYTDNLVEYLRRELQIELGKLNDKFHEKTLAQIFVENRIYKRIEECGTYELVLAGGRKGLAKFRSMLKRDITDEDIEKLLAIPIRRISLFDINKNKKDIDDIVLAIAETEKNLKRIKNFTIKFIKGLLQKYAPGYPRKTQIEKFDKIDVKAVALNNIKVGWDRKNCFVGTDVKSDETMTCNEFDKLLCIERNAKYRVVSIPEKQFIGKLFYFCKYDKDQIFNIIYRDKDTDICYAKRTRIPKFITDKEYFLAPEGSKIEIINAKPGYVYECVLEGKIRKSSPPVLVDFAQIPEKGTKSRGVKISSKKILDFKFVSSGEDTQPPAQADADGNIAQSDGDAQVPEPPPSVNGKITGPPVPDEGKPVQEELGILTSDDDSEIKGKGAGRRTPKSAKVQKRSSPSQKSGKSNDEAGKDEWGISQPEFGF